MTVERGDVVAVFGANGSGKSTLLRIAATLTRATAGQVLVNGDDASRDSPSARRHIGAVMHAPMLYSDLTARENLALFATLCQLPDVAARIAAVATRFRLTRRLDERVRKLSHGYRKRVAIARAVLHSPTLLLLDEPETGLDAASLEDLQSTVETWRANGRSVIMATHNRQLVADIADRTYEMAHGRLSRVS